MFIIINLFIFLILNIIIYNLDENKMGKKKLINLLICFGVIQMKCRMFSNTFFLNELNYNYVFILFNYLFWENQDDNNVRIIIK